MSPVDMRRAVERYRRLLSLYPETFRRRFADSMCAAFAAEVEDARSAWARARLWSVTVAHLLAHAALEHMSGWQGLGSELRLAVRTLLRRPGYAAVVVATLTIGIGANATIFNLVNAYLFAPLPFEDGDRLVHLRDVVTRPGEPTWWYTPSPRSFHAVRDNFTQFSEVAAHEYRVVNLAAGERVAQVTGAAVSDRWLETIGTGPVVGRGFSETEQARGAGSRVVMLGHALWTQLLGADRETIGRPVSLDGEPYTVIGVLGPGFRYPWGAELWVMGDFDPNSGAFSTGTVARLAAGADVEAVRPALAEFSRGVARAYPDTHRDITFDIVSMRENIFGNRPAVSLVLMGAVALLLLIACATVAGVAIARLLSRRDELALRRMLGAGGLSLVRLVFLEGAVLAFLGGALGLGSAWLARGWLTGLVAAPETGLGQVGSALEVDGSVVAFTVALTALVATVTALVPAICAGRRRVSTVPATPARGLSLPVRRALSGAVAVEAALAVPLLLAAGLIYEAYHALASVEPGYESADRVAVRLSLPERRFPDRAARLQTLDRIVSRVQAEPGVIAAGYAHHLPVTPGDWTRTYSIDGGVASEPGRGVRANVRWIGASYFDAIGMPMLHGRTFTADEMARAADVVVLSRTLAEAHFEGGNAVGGRFKLGALDDDTPWLDIVGVVDQAREEWAFEETFYLPYSARPLDFVELVVHAGPGVPPGAVRTAIREADPGQAADELRSLSVLEEEELRSDRIGALVVVLFGLAGLALTVLGIFGSVSYVVRQRDREMGVRVALGSGGRELVGLIVREGTRPLLLGVALGTLVALAVLPLLSSRLTSVGEAVQVQLLASGLDIDLRSLALVVAILLGAGAMACLVPARAALAQDPARALRSD